MQCCDEMIFGVLMVSLIIIGKVTDTDLNTDLNTYK